MKFLKLSSCGKFIWESLLLASQWRLSRKNFLLPLSYEKLKSIYLLLKFRYSEKATKFLKNLPFFRQFGRFFSKLYCHLWISELLMIFLFIKNSLVIAQKKNFSQKCMRKIPKPDSHYCLLVCQVRYRTPSHELSNKKGGNGSYVFLRQHLLTLILQSDKWSVLIAVLLCSKTSTYLFSFVQ